MPQARSCGKKGTAKHRKASRSKRTDLESEVDGIPSTSRQSDIQPQSLFETKQNLQDIPKDPEDAGSDAFKPRTGNHQDPVRPSTTGRDQSHSDNGAGREDQAPAVLESDYQQRSENQELCSVCNASRVLLCCDGCLKVCNEGCSHSSPVFRPGDLAVPWYCEACLLKRAAAAHNSFGHSLAASHDERLAAHVQTGQQEEVDKEDLRDCEPAQTKDDGLERVQEHHEFM